MRVVGWALTAVSFIVAGYCAAFALIGIVSVVLWWGPDHTAVAILAASGPLLAPLVLRRAGDEAASAVSYLPAADAFVADLIRSTLGGHATKQLTVRSCPGERVVVLRAHRRTMVLVPDGIEPTDAARRAARDLALGRGWVLPWVMRVVRLPGMYVAGIVPSMQQAIGTLLDSTDRFRAGGKALGLFVLTLFALPATVFGWVASQLAMLLIGSRLLAAYVAVTCRSENGPLGLRERMLLPRTWYGRSRAARAPGGAPRLRARSGEGESSATATRTSARPKRLARPAQHPAASAEPYVVLASSFLLVGALYLAVTGLVDSVVWWDESPVTATVTKSDVVEHESKPPRLSVGWHPTQNLTVALADGDAAFLESSAATYSVGDPIRLARTASSSGDTPYLRAVPGKSANDRVVNLVFGLGWAALFALPITYQGNRRVRSEIWSGPQGG